MLRNIEIFDGEKFLLLGANGSGKTTLLRTLATLLTPSLGQLHLFGSKEHPSVHRGEDGVICLIIPVCTKIFLFRKIYKFLDVLWDCL